MFTRLGNFAVRRRGLALVLTTIALVIAAVLGPGVIDRLAGSGFDDPDADSVAARAELDRIFDTGFADLVFLITGEGAANAGVVDREEIRDAGLRSVQLSVQDATAASSDAPATSTRTGHSAATIPTRWRSAAPG